MKMMVKRVERTMKMIVIVMILIPLVDFDSLIYRFGIDSLIH